MARTLVAAISPPNASGAAYNPGTPLTALSAGLTFTACDASNFNYTPLISGKTVLYFWNTDSVSHTVTIYSVVDPQNRIGDITTYALAAGAAAGAADSISMFGPFTSQGWAQTSPAGLWFDASSALVLVLVVTNP